VGVKIKMPKTTNFFTEKHFPNWWFIVLCIIIVLLNIGLWLNWNTHCSAVVMGWGW
jgi:hypothetical protein